MSGDTRMAETAEPRSLRERVQSLRLPESVNAAGRPSLLPWVLVVLLAVGFAGVGLRGQSPNSPTDKVAEKTKVDTTEVIDDVALETKGYVIPARQIQVSPIEVAGRVVKLDIIEGMRVKTGDVLAELDPTSYAAELQEAKSQLAAAGHRARELANGYLPEEREQAEAELKEARETLTQRERDYNRNKKIDNRALAEKEMEEAEFLYRAQKMRVVKLEQALHLILRGPREERIAAANAEVEAWKARLQRAEWRLNNCKIKAPVDGTILTKKAEIGSLLSPMSFNVAASLCEMANLSDLEIELDVVERDIAKVKPGQKCRIVCEAYPDRVYQGVVARLMPIANRAKAAVPVRVKVLGVPAEEEGLYLKPEMGARVSFLKTGAAK